MAPSVSFAEFLKQYQELIDWLNQVQRNTQRTVNSLSEKYLNQVGGSHTVSGDFLYHVCWRGMLCLCSNLETSFNHACGTLPVISVYTRVAD